MKELSSIPQPTRSGLACFTSATYGRRHVCGFSRPVPARRPVPAEVRRLTSREIRPSSQITYRKGKRLAQESACSL